MNCKQLLFAGLTAGALSFQVGWAQTHQVAEPDRPYPRYEPTPPEIVDAMLKLAKVEQGDVVYDLGSGDGRIVITAVDKFGAARAVGVELNGDLVKRAQRNARKAGVEDRVRFLQSDIFDTDVRQATVVTLYLLPEVNLLLRPKLLSDLAPGTRIVSHSHDMGDWIPEQTIEIEDRRRKVHRLHLWTVPPRQTAATGLSFSGGGMQEAFRFAKDVPYVPTSDRVVEKMLDMAKVGPNDKVYDLGCGDGRIVIAAAKRGARGVGIDIDPQRIRESRANAETAGVTDKVKFIAQDLFEADLRDADVVTLYLLSSVNMRLRPKLLRELKPGTRIVSHAFDMGNWKPLKQEDIDGTTVYYWVVPESRSIPTGG